MADEIPDIVILADPIDPHVLRTLVDRFFEDMVKVVVDDERLRARVRDLTFKLVGRGEPLP